MGRAGWKEITEMHIRICFCDSGAHMGRAARKEIAEMHIRLCVSVLSVLTLGESVGRTSQKCTYVSVFL